MICSDYPKSETLTVRTRSIEEIKSTKSQDDNLELSHIIQNKNLSKESLEAREQNDITSWLKKIY